jgi:hypothetical protein
VQPEHVVPLHGLALRIGGVESAQQICTASDHSPRDRLRWFGARRRHRRIVQRAERAGEPAPSFRARVPGTTETSRSHVSLACTRRSELGTQRLWSPSHWRTCSRELSAHRACTQIRSIRAHSACGQSWYRDLLPSNRRPATTSEPFVRVYPPSRPRLTLTSSSRRCEQASEQSERVSEHAKRVEEDDVMGAKRSERPS